MDFKNLYKRCNRLIFGKNDELTLERRIHILITFLASGIIFIGTVANIILQMNLWVIIIMIAAFIVMVIFFVIARNSKNYERSIIPLFIISMILFSAVWFLNAGYDGNLISLMLVYFLALNAIVQQKYKTVLLLIFLTVFSSLVLIQYHFPELIIPYDNREQRFVDLLVGNILYFFFIYFIIGIILKYYTAENKEIVLMNEQLKIKNSEIAENNLKIEESEEKYKIITQSTLDVIFMLNNSGTLLFFNERLEKVLGYKNEELIGRPFAELFPTKELQGYLAKLKEIFSRGEVADFITKIYHKSGHLVDVEINGKVVRQRGEQVGQGTIRDITERNRTADALAVSESNLQSLINNRNESIWSLDSNYKLIICNEYFKNAYRAAYDVELKIGINLVDILSPELREYWKPKYDAVLAGEKILFEFNETILGMIFYFEVSLNPIITEGIITGVSALSSDITKIKLAEISLRSSEERQRFILASLPVAIYTSPLDSEYDTTWISGDIEKITGFSIEEFLSENDFWRKRLHPEDKERVLLSYKEKYIDKERIYEYRWKCKDDRYHWFQDRSVLREIEARMEYLGVLVDITERKQAEDTLRVSEERFRSILQDVQSIAVQGYGIDGTTLYWNHASERLYGYSAHEAIGRKLTDLIIPPEMRNDVEQAIQQMAETGQPIPPSELSLMRKDGSRVAVFSNHTIVNVPGRVQELFCIDIDLSERKMAEDALRESEEKFRVLFESAKDGIYQFTLEGEIIAVNESFARMHGYTVGELIGKNFIDLDTPESKRRAPERLQKLLSGETMTFEIEHYCKNGQTIPLEVSANLVTIGGQKYILGFHRDITERKRSDEALKESERFLRETQIIAKLGSYTLEIASGRWSSSEVLDSIFGIDSNYDKSVKGWTSIIHPEWQKMMIDYFNHEVVGNKTKFDKEYKIIRQNDKAERWVHGIGELKFNDAYEPIFMVGTIKDITEHKKSEETLHQAQKLESIGVLAGGIAHDFNNLLAAMMGNVALAKKRIPVGHPSLINLERTLTAVERAASLTKQILAYSGKGKFQIIDVDIAKIVQEHIDLFEASMPKNVKFVTHLSETPVTIKGDPGQIEQIIMNLIINAGEAIGEKQGIVHINVSTITMTDEDLLPYGILNHQKLKSGEYASFQVSDNGIGMNEETTAKIFDPFFSTKFVGRGLGLSAVLGIIRGHGGGIMVTSTAGLGTTFHVLLPLFRSGVDSKHENGRRKETPLQLHTLLVIDDEQYIVDLVNDIFSEEKYQRLSATDPEKGILIYKEFWQSIDLVILDYAMPKINGKDVLAELKKINQDVVVIMSSGYSEEEINHLMGGSKPSAFIQKPFSPDALLSLIKKILNAS